MQWCRRIDRCGSLVSEGGAASAIYMPQHISEASQRFLGLCKGGLDYNLVEDLKGYVVKLLKFAKYAQILKNSMA